MSWLLVIREWCWALCPFIFSKKRGDNMELAVEEPQDKGLEDEDGDILPETIMEELETIVEEQRSLDEALENIQEETECEVAESETTRDKEKIEIELSGNEDSVSRKTVKESHSKGESKVDCSEEEPKSMPEEEQLCDISSEKPVMTSINNSYNS
ncbi:hypothetical protein HHI36_019013 [Cryptolaemus montrouzieri]|uniref:Uncharacterized protein n=1 Tax=Cryptolaemus montrouzieri TaxID=559131 RepID=A0ABD2P2H4_9CUCU